MIYADITNSPFLNKLLIKTFENSNLLCLKSSKDKYLIKNNELDMLINEIYLKAQNEVTHSYETSKYIINYHKSSKQPSDKVDFLLKTTELIGYPDLNSRFKLTKSANNLKNQS